MAVDKPNVHLSLANLRKETEKVEEFTLALSGSKRITFPDIYGMESEDAENLVRKIDDRTYNWEALRLWLTKADADALKAEKLTMRQLMQVIQAAQNHYEGVYGTPGEGSASEG